MHTEQTNTWTKISYSVVSFQQDQLWNGVRARWENLSGKKTWVVMEVSIEELLPTPSSACVESVLRSPERNECVVVKRNVIPSQRSLPLFASTWTFCKSCTFKENFNIPPGKLCANWSQITTGWLETTANIFRIYVDDFSGRVGKPHCSYDNWNFVAGLKPVTCAPSARDLLALTLQKNKVHTFTFQQMKDW